MPGIDGPGGCSNLFRPSGLQLREQPWRGLESFNKPQPHQPGKLGFFWRFSDRDTPIGTRQLLSVPAMLLAQHFHEV